MQGKITVAIMQPYIFPYVGYFSLAQACDHFVFYDDVHFIKRGRINRNRVLINGDPHMFSIPLTNGSQNELIKNVKTHEFGRFRDKFLKQLNFSYKKAPYFNEGMGYVEKVFSSDTSYISNLAIKSVEHLYEHINVEKNFLSSSDQFTDSKGMEKAHRLISITKAMGADSYVNAIGGKELYSKDYFLNHGGVSLSFVKAKILPYKQVGVNSDFEAGLSIIDIVMNNDADDILTLINSYELA